MGTLGSTNLQPFVLEIRTLEDFYLPLGDWQWLSI